MPVPYHAGEGADQVLELTRASAVGPDGSVIYDKLVRGGKRDCQQPSISIHSPALDSQVFVFFFLKPPFKSSKYTYE